MDARELPARPSLEQYKKQAKDLLKAWKSADREAIERIKHFHPRFQSSAFSLADAQFTIAREHGFESWPKFAEHIKAANRQSSSVSTFESAADAVISGDVATLVSLIRENPQLIRARSTRRHNSTLLHYVSANGVEDYRQKTPKNAVEVAKILLDAGAEVDALQTSYGGHNTTLTLVATSIRPARAGVQIALIDTLLEHGASVDGPDNPVMAALANNRPEGAEALVERGARVNDIVAAAGVGRLDLVKSLMDQSAAGDIAKAFVWAGRYGRTAVVDFLLQKGVDPAAADELGMTALHWATGTGSIDVINLLLKRGAPLEAKNSFGGTVLGQAVWFAFHPQWHGVDRVLVIKTLIDAGARLDAYPSLKDDVDRVLHPVP